MPAFNVMRVLMMVAASPLRCCYVYHNGLYKVTAQKKVLFT
jgi:hypothetical protein